MYFGDFSKFLSLKELMKNVSFNPGDRYADYQAGDKLADIGLEDLIMGKDAKVSASFMIKPAIWAGVIFIACASAGTGGGVRE